MMDAIKRLFRKPTPLERAVRELGNLEHALLDVDAEIMWAQKRREYHVNRREFLRVFTKENS